MVSTQGVSGEPGVQESCAETTPFPPANISDNPYFEVGPQQFSANVSGRDIHIHDLSLAGSFAPDGSYIDGVVFSGLIDTRPFGGLFDDEGGSTDEAFCEFAQTAGIDCVACPDGSGAFCVSIQADRILADGIGASIEIIDDICDKPECAADPVCTDA